MLSTSSLQVALGALFVVSTTALPSVNSLGSGLQILMHNDLYGDQSARSGAVIIAGEAGTRAAGAKICTSLGESLWTPPSTLTQDNFLAYLTYQAGKGKRSTHAVAGAVTPEAQKALYYIAGNAANGQCQAITPYAQIVTVNCKNKLPAICTQSAPTAGFNTSNFNTQYQTSVTSGPTTYTGFRDHLSFRFLGIKYGSFPQRFTYSSVYQPSGVQDALEFRPICIQVDAIYGYPNGVEDCLHLNVYTPYLPKGKPAKNKLKAVMLWIHGGGLNNGYGSDPTFDGGNLASRGDVVVVTINYRLGSLGYLAIGNGTGLNGNYGLSDQVTALQWVKNNIVNFGGDPDRVTIFGQSAGAESVQALIRSPPAAGLFSAAIQQSIGYVNASSIASTSATANRIISLTGCSNGTTADVLACLRAFPAIRYPTLGTNAASLVVDGTYLTTSDWGFDGSSHVNKVPLIIGNMRDDGAPFLTFVNTTNLTLSLSTNGEPVATVLNNPSIFPYPTGPNPVYNVFNVTAQVNTDTFDRCQDQAITYAAAQYNTFPELYKYEFNFGYQITYWPAGQLKTFCNAVPDATHPNGNPANEYYRCHSGELMLEFATWRKWGLPERDANDTPMTQYTVDTWSSFARTHNPTPDAEYLNIRGYVNTTKVLGLSGAWKKVTKNSLTQSLFGWPSQEVGFRYEDQCAALGYPTNYLV